MENRVLIAAIAGILAVGGGVGVVAWQNTSHRTSTPERTGAAVGATAPAPAARAPAQQILQLQQAFPGATGLTPQQQVERIALLLQLALRLPEQPSFSGNTLTLQWEGDRMLQAPINAVHSEGEVLAASLTFAIGEWETHWQLTFGPGDHGTLQVSPDAAWQAMADGLLRESHGRIAVGLSPHGDAVVMAEYWTPVVVLSPQLETHHEGASTASVVFTDNGRRYTVALQQRCDDTHLCGYFPLSISW
ncbi:MAG: hypothetical protein IMW91_01075 [Firmicutes bacterium]|nr:hypothetical protein [Bacillota bacterium]